MTAILERPLRARAGLRSMIYRLATRARQTPMHHPLRLQLEEELADLKAQLAEVEQYLAALSPPRPSTLAVATGEVPLRDMPRAARPASASQGDARHARSEETRSEWTTLEKHELSDPGQVPSRASIAARYRLAVIQSWHRAGALAARVTAGNSSAAHRMLETIGESVIEFWVVVFRAPGHFTRGALRTFSQYGSVTTRTWRRAVILTQQGMAGSSRRLLQSVEISVASGKEFRALIGRILSRSSDRPGAVLDSCLVLAANLRRVSGAVTRQCMTASVSLLHQSRQMAVATSTKLWRPARQTLIRTSDRINAGLGQCRVATDRRQKVGQAGSRWAGSFRRIVAFRIAAGAGAAAGAGWRAAERASAEGKRGIVAGRFILQKVMADARDKGREISTASRRLWLQISDRVQKAIAVSRPVAFQAWRTARSATLRSATRCQQIALESLKAARAKWAVLSPKLQQAGVEAKKGIVAGRLFLQKVIAAPDKGRSISTFCRRLSLRTSDSARKALAVSRPAAIQALRNARSATLRGAVQCQQIARESLKTARTKWTELSPKLQQAGVEAKKGIVAGRLFLQQVMADAPDRGRAISTFCRRFSLQISDRARRALAVSRPAAIQALRYTRSATLQGAARCQQIALESLKTARAKWTELSRHAALAGAAVGRRAAPKLQQAGVQAKRDIAAGKLFLEKVMASAHIKGGEISTFCRRLPLRISDSVRKSARRLPSPGDSDLAA